jgi:competence protein ComEA
MGKLRTAASLVVLCIGLSFALSLAAEINRNPPAARAIVPTKIKPLDINSASIEELKALPGIDDGYAHKIVENRPYEKRDDLVSKKVLPEATYKKIKDRIITVPQKARAFSAYALAFKCRARAFPTFKPDAVAMVPAFSTVR